MRSADRGGGRRVALTRERVVAAALTLVDRRGLAALTMRRLGAELSVEAMSLYRYLPSKAALHAALADRVLSEIVFPRPSGHWRRDLINAGRLFWRALNAHPHVVPLIAATPRETRASAGGAEAMLRLITQDGLSPARAHQILRIIQAYAIGSAIIRQASESLGPASRPGGAPGEFPLLHRALGGGRPIDREKDFEIGMGLLLDAVATRSGGRP